MTPLIGFSPDSDPTTPGILTDCVNMIPTLRGMKTSPSAQNQNGVDVLADRCLGAATVAKLDGTRRIFSAIDTNLYELNASGTWDDVSKVGGYSLSPEVQVVFAQFGD